MGFDFTVIAPLLQSHRGFSFVFGCGVSFLASSSVFLSMTVHQLVVILVFSQGGVRAHPSTLPSCFRHLRVLCISQLIVLRNIWKFQYDKVNITNQDISYSVLTFRNHSLSYEAYFYILFLLC